jgi:hypothetical protein
MGMGASVHAAAVSRSTAATAQRLTEGIRLIIGVLYHNLSLPGIAIAIVIGIENLNRRSFHR